MMSAVGALHQAMVAGLLEELPIAMHGMERLSRIVIRLCMKIYYITVYIISMHIIYIYNTLKSYIIYIPIV